jgi:phosphoglycolate phosphatase-like HAD superfamily hydrolase
MAVRVAILDFDGTLVDSVDIKDRAFEALFSDRPELPAIMHFHLAHNHMIRFEKFRTITTELLGEVYTPERERDLTERFSALVARAIAEAPEVPGASALLDALAAAAVRTYMVSMSPGEEFLRILEARGLAGRFAGVYAYPWKKVAAVAEILRIEGTSPDDAVMVGDSPEDAVAAAASGVAFIGRDSGKEFAPDLPVYPDLHGVLGHLRGSMPPHKEGESRG